MHSTDKQECAGHFVMSFNDLMIWESEKMMTKIVAKIGNVFYFESQKETKLISATDDTELWWCESAKETELFTIWSSIRE